MMKRNILMLFIAMILASCENEEKKAEGVVNEFLTLINGESYKGELLDDKIITKNYELFFKENRFFTSNNWKLNLKSKNDSIVIVESKSQGTNSFGVVSELIQTFYLKKENFKIYDSNNLVTNYSDFDIIGIDWESLSDMKRNEIFKNIKDNLTVKVIEKGYKVGSKSDYVEGVIRVYNNSKYDIKNLKVLIEHFDNNKKSVNTDQEYINDIVRKNGQREASWITPDCFDCEEQEVKINFIKED
jgi:hypothetical protein